MHAEEFQDKIDYGFNITQTDPFNWRLEFEKYYLDFFSLVFYEIIIFRSSFFQGFESTERCVYQTSQRYLFQ